MPFLMKPGTSQTQRTPSRWSIRYCKTDFVNETQLNGRWLICSQAMNNVLPATGKLDYLLCRLSCFQIELALAYGCEESVGTERLVQYIHQNRNHNALRIDTQGHIYTNQPKNIILFFKTTHLPSKLIFTRNVIKAFFEQAVRWRFSRLR